MRKMKLETPLSKYHVFSTLKEGRGKLRKIDKDDLSRLLVDHSRMAARLRELGVEVVAETDGGK